MSASVRNMYRSVVSPCSSPGQLEVTSVATYPFKRDVRRANRELKKVLSETPILQQLQDGVVQVLGRPGVSVTAVEGAPNVNLSYTYFQGQGIDTVVHITNLWIGLAGVPNFSKFHPTSAQFKMIAGLEVAGTQDGDLILNEAFTYTGGTRELVGWVTGDGSRLIAEIEKGRSSLIEMISVALSTVFS